MNEREEEINHYIASALAELHELSEKFAKKPDQFLAINDAEQAIHAIRRTFQQEIQKELS